NSSSKLSLFELLTDKNYEKLVNTEFLDSILKSGIYISEEKQLYKVEQLIHHKKYTDALFLAQEVILRNSNYHKAYYLRSVISSEMNDLNKALNDINRALEITKVPAKYYFQRAQLLAKKNDYQNALADIKKVIRKEPYHTEYYLFKAELLFQLERYNEVVSIIDALLPLMPDNPEVLILKAKTLYHDQKFLEALKVVNESFDYRQSKNQFELRGDIYSATNTYAYAIQDYSMYLDIEPYNGDIYAKKGYARLKTGDKTGACSDWEKGKRYGSYEAIKYWEKYCR
ncbi:MAG: tetratricopeptide repeat protein, partial [Bacteroidales bacterium]